MCVCVRVCVCECVCVRVCVRFVDVCTQACVRMRQCSISNTSIVQSTTTALPPPAFASPLLLNPCRTKPLAKFRAQDLLVGISYFDPNITSQQCDNALMRLEEMAVVLLNEEMEDGLHMLKATLIRPPEAPPPPRVPESQLFQQHVRASRSDPLRDAIRANATLVHMLKQYNHCDERLYARAVQIFHEAKQRLLG